MVSELTAKDGLVWSDYDEALPEELAQFARESELEAADAEFVVQNHQRPEVAWREKYVLILIHVPVFDKQVRITKGVPLYVIVGEKKVWTVHQEPIVSLEKLMRDYQEVPDKFEEYTSDGAMGLALHLTGAMYAGAFKKLERLAKHIDIAEDAIFSGNERKMVEEVAVLRRDVMDFRKVIRPQINLFTDPPQHALLVVGLRSQWRRLHGQTNKLWEVLESLYESVNDLSQTNESLLQHKVNELLRLLTYYSIFSIPVLMLLQAVNPFAPNNSLMVLIIFWTMLFLLVVILVFILLRFKRKKVL
ncbi:MAG: CorA family divalent cation transporter [Candidatus Andersenbacteria bacterium]|nr:CorA family divalent cation transporter [bacterium]MDZ4225557.1 CorA family divalent cation transporter [Candidatus Andersenbacteria bacterium]